jgi:hypothetical protein
MEFIVKYDENNENLESNLEPNLNDLESKINNISNDEIDELSDNISDETLDIITKKIKRKPSQKQLDALKQSRIKATAKIKENKELRQKIIEEKEREESGDLDFLAERMKYYQSKLKEKEALITNVNDEYSKPKTKTYRLTQLDFMIDKLFK